MMRSSQKPSTQQRELRFEDEEIWMKLPEAVRERCRTLWKELLASVLNKDEGRQPDERQD